MEITMEYIFDLFAAIGFVGLIAWLIEEILI
jgi:hypothetical protein